MLNISLVTSQPFNIPQVKTLCLALYPILRGIFGSLESNFLSSLHTLDISPLLEVGLVKIFSQSIGFLFLILAVSVALQKLGIQ